MSVAVDLAGKTTLITGATRGIGRSIAEAFHQAGSDLILTGTNLNELPQFRSEQYGSSQARWIEAEFSSINGIDSFVKKLDGLGQIDICINNAGINIIKPFPDYTNEEIDRLLNINLSAPLMVSRKVIPGMAGRAFGRIVNISSIWSEISKAGRSLYSTSKAGLVGLTRTLAIEYAGSNVLVNAVSPGFTRTELTTRSLTSTDIDEIKMKIPAKRLAEPREIAYTVLFLCSDLNSYITGQNIIADGGFTIV